MIRWSDEAKKRKSWDVGGFFEDQLLLDITMLERNKVCTRVKHAHPLKRNAPSKADNHLSPDQPPFKHKPYPAQMHRHPDPFSSSRPALLPCTKAVHCRAAHPPRFAAAL